MKSTYETLTGILTFYSKQPTANDDTYSYYQNKGGNEEKNPPFTSILDLMNWLYPNLFKAEYTLVTRDANAGWREHDLSEIILEYKSEGYDIEINDVVTTYFSYEEALKAITDSLNYIPLRIEEITSGDTTNVKIVQKNIFEINESAQFETKAQYYTVTFVDHDNTFIASDEVESGGSATAPADPSREGYTFDGWDADITNVTSSFTVKAEYRLNVVNNNNNDDDEELEERQIPAATPQVSQPVTIVDLGEEEELPGGPAIVEEKDKEPKEEKENEPEEELITLDIPAEAIPEGSGLPQTGQLPVELFVGLGGLITAAGVFLKRKQ